MKTTTLTLSEQELNDLKEFYTMQLARARREVAHYESILYKLEQGEKPAEKVIGGEPPIASVKTKRGRPRKAITEAAAAIPEPQPIPEAQFKGKRGRPRKDKIEALTQTIDVESILEDSTEPKGKKQKAKSPYKSGEKVRGPKMNSRGRKSLIPELDIPYTDFILRTLANADRPLAARDMIAIMKDEYKLGDKALLKKAEISLRSSLSGLKKKNKISFFKSDEGVDKYYPSQPLNDLTSAETENPPVEA